MLVKLSPVTVHVCIYYTYINTIAYISLILFPSFILFFLLNSKYLPTLLAGV